MPGLEIGLIREVVVLAPGSAEATREISEAMGARLIESAPDLADWETAGAAEARGDWLLFLPSQASLAYDWAERADMHMLTRPDVAACFRFRLRSDAREARRLEEKVSQHLARGGPPLAEQGLLMPRALYEEIASQITAEVPADIRSRLVGRGELDILDADAQLSSYHYEQRGWQDSRLPKQGILTLVQGALSRIGARQKPD